MRLPRQRRQTLLLMRLARRQSPIALSTTVDMTAVQQHRHQTAPPERPAAYVSYVTSCAARALRTRPAANVALYGRLWPRIAGCDRIVAKVAVDMCHDDVRFVAGALVPDADQADLARIDTTIRRFAALDAATAPELSRLRVLWRAPWPVAALGFAATLARPPARTAALGTFSVSSLGNRAVEAVAPLGGTTVSVGVGVVREAAVVRDGRIVVRPVMTLTLVFDHRIIDGILAADLLTDVADRLESWPADPRDTAENGAAAPVRAVPAAGELATGQARG